LKHEAPINFIAKLTTDKIAGSEDHKLRIFNSKSGLCLKVLQGHICSRVISNEKVISGSINNTIQVWDIEANLCSKTLKGHNDLVHGIIQLSNEKVASCSKNGQIWNIIKDECIMTFETDLPIHHLHNLSNQVIISCHDSMLKVLNIENAKCWKTLKIGSTAIEINNNIF